MAGFVCSGDGTARLLLVCYFEGIDMEREIAWRAGDSLSIREFVGIPLDEGHRTTRRSRGHAG